LPDSANVFNDLIRGFQKVAMAVEIVPQEPVTIEAGMRRFDLRALWRLSAWGGGAAVALAAAAFASQTDVGSQRLAAVASAELPKPTVTAVKIPPQREQEWEIARLQTQLRTLTADRDRLVERVASLEHSIEDITGSIKRQAAPTSGQPPVQPAPRASAPPVIAPPATTNPKTTEEPAPAATVDTPAALPPQQTAEPPHQAVPLPPVRVAALPAEPAPPPPKLEFGVALARSSNLDVLRLQWTALKANFGPMLAGLRPIAAREQHGTATQYRLVLSPLPNLLAAAKLCGRLTAAHAICQVGKFAGEPL
jgi:hypothetical protein